MHISLRPNEKIYINGAVLKVDRKVSIELLNDAVFLLEAHVMLEQKATTPLRKLYFIAQLMLMEPQDTESKKILFNLQALSISGHCKDPAILTGLSAVSDLVNKGRAFEALKVIRTMLPMEDELLKLSASPPADAAEPASPPRNEARPVARPSRPKADQQVVA